jgi:hypothetical protein
MIRTCARCKQIISAERLEILPDTHTCVACSGVQKYVGMNVFTHKTAPSVVFIRPENKEAVETLRREFRRARN